MSWLSQCLRYSLSAIAELLANLRYRLSVKKPSSHGLPGNLIVSFTSYPPRFKKLHLTIKCLLDQSIRPDLIILWVSEKDFHSLPENVLKLENEYFKVQTTVDTKSYKKIIPALSSYPEAFVVTCDDDTWYPKDWLEHLVSGWCGSLSDTVCHRARAINVDSQGNILPYMSWGLIDKNSKPKRGEAHENVFPTGMGGVLYPPGCLGDKVMNENLFMELCPTGDDIWLYWHIRLNGGRSLTTRKKLLFIQWNGSEQTSLYSQNIERNDLQLSSIQERYPIAFTRSEP